LVTVMLLSLVGRGIQRAEGGELFDAALITLFFALDLLQHMVTIAFLLATVLTFTRAVQDRELIAIRAAGIPPRTPMMAAVLLGIGLSVFSSFAMHYVLPEIHFRKYRVIADVVRNTFINLKLGSDRIKVLDTGFVLTFREREKGSGDYLDCTLYCPKPIGGLDSTILTVERVSIPPIREDTEMLSVDLRGVVDPIGTARGGNIQFNLSLNDIGTRERRDDRDDDLRSDQLLAEVMRGVHRKPYEAVFTLFRRCCFALMPAVLAPIGYCIAELARERGRIVALLMSLVPLILFYFGDVLGMRLLRANHESWLAWLPMILMGAFGVPLCWSQLRR
jgi:lipopolysaccharide export LptBFGC system permease protein LptF